MEGAAASCIAGFYKIIKARKEVRKRYKVRYFSSHKKTIASTAAVSAMCILNVLRIWDCRMVQRAWPSSVTANSSSYFDSYLKVREFVSQEQESCWVLLTKHHEHSVLPLCPPSPSTLRSRVYEARTREAQILSKLSQPFPQLHASIFRLENLRRLESRAVVEKQKIRGEWTATHEMFVKQYNVLRLCRMLMPGMPWNREWDLQPANPSPSSPPAMSMISPRHRSVVVANPHGAGVGMSMRGMTVEGVSPRRRELEPYVGLKLTHVNDFPVGTQADAATVMNGRDNVKLTFEGPHDEVTVRKGANGGIGCIFEETLLQQVVPRSTAEEAGVGIHIGRHVTHVNGSVVTSLDEICQVAARHSDRVVLRFSVLPSPRLSPIASPVLSPRQVTFGDLSHNNISPPRPSSPVVRSPITSRPLSPLHLRPSPPSFHARAASPAGDIPLAFRSVSPVPNGVHNLRSSSPPMMSQPFYDGMMPNMPASYIPPPPTVPMRPVMPVMQPQHHQHQYQHQHLHQHQQQQQQPLPPPPEEPGSYELTIEKDPNESLGLNLQSMILNDVAPESAAHRSGAERFLGFRLTHVNGEPVSTLQTLGSRAAQMSILVLRFSQQMVEADEVTMDRTQQDSFGFRLENMVLMEVGDNTPEDRAGLKAFVGRRLTHVNGYRVTNIDEVRNAMTMIPGSVKLKFEAILPPGTRVVTQHLTGNTVPNGVQGVVEGHHSLGGETVARVHFPYHGSVNVRFTNLQVPSSPRPLVRSLQPPSFAPFPQVAPSTSAHEAVFDSPVQPIALTHTSFQNPQPMMLPEQHPSYLKGFI